MTGAPVHVGVTVEQAWQRVPGGSASYLVELLHALRERTDLRLTGLAAAHRHPAPEEYRVPVPVRSLGLPRYPLYRAWNWLGAPRPEWAVRGLDVVHASTWAIPPTARPLVVTVHDLAFLRDPDHFTPRGVGFFTRALERTRREASAVVVPSRATADDCVAAGLDPARVHVVPHGAPQWDVTAQDVADVRRRLALPERFVLWCGTFEPRKNVAGVLAAFARLAERDPGVDLVLVGPPGWGDLPAQPPAGAWQSRVLSLGRLPAADLRAVYAAATAFCFPSLWEGFGLPVLEAMSVGTPVVTSRDTSMAEVTGDAGVLVDPHDPDDLAAGLERALGDSDALGAAARARAAGFRWDDAAEQHARVYRAVAAG
ncbi:glycosyl transferase family 1 [Cellulomonas hominis]|uniref:Glycosyl transferase family 1 n=1 Tax=Cellulomonas hominis TaxID=156981 RepID=A0A511FAB0_9CELL|nr:glycosyltransferase family 1 protein [Cellulomonas hominis]MBB5474018.1 glycosyltransferase involved in cell wall biosynthesis [Cellulomonas hominis]GEL45187.1 glycosyl transferase family 1 [Cellulomonas hominis]